MYELTKKLYTLDETEVSSLYKKVFDPVEAKLVLEDLRNRCFVKTTTLGMTDSATNFNEGMRAVFLHIESQINYEPATKQDGGNND